MPLSFPLTGITLSINFFWRFQSSAEQMWQNCDCSCFFPPWMLLDPTEPEALSIYLNYSSAVLKAMPQGAVQAEISPNQWLHSPFCIGIEHCCKSLLSALPVCWPPMSFTMTKCLGFCPPPQILQVLSDCAGCAHLQAQSGTPRMRPGRACKVCPLTWGLPHSPQMTLWHRAVNQRLTTGTGPNQPSAPAGAHLQKNE